MILKFLEKQIRAYFIFIILSHAILLTKFPLQIAVKLVVFFFFCVICGYPLLWGYIKFWKSNQTDSELEIKITLLVLASIIMEFLIIFDKASLNIAVIDFVINAIIMMVLYFSKKYNVKGALFCKKKPKEI